MEPVLQSLLAGLPVLLLHFGVTVAMLALGVTIYIWLTPYPEIALIRQGNTAAAVSMSGAVLGLALPLAICLASSVNVYDIIVWGVVTLMVQLIAYRVMDLLLRELPKRIENDEIGPALLLVAVKIGVAAINAAAIAG
jgi:putative membrane protein